MTRLTSSKGTLFFISIPREPVGNNFVTQPLGAEFHSPSWGMHTSLIISDCVVPKRADLS